MDYMAEHLTATRARWHHRTGGNHLPEPDGVQAAAQDAGGGLPGGGGIPACWGVLIHILVSRRPILILDRASATRTDTIAFFKVGNDGFDLGAQRRPIERDDLPEVQAELGAFLIQLRAGETVDESRLMAGRVVAKDMIAKDGEYNLTGDRYQEAPLPSTEYPLRRVGELVKPISPPVKLQRPDFGEMGRFPIIDQSQTEIAGWTDDESTLVTPDGPVVIFGDHTCRVKLVEVPFAQGADGIKILETNADTNARFLYLILLS